MRKIFFIAAMSLIFLPAISCDSPEAITEIIPEDIPGVITDKNILEVGPGRQFDRLQSATLKAKPGNIILIREGIYGGGDVISNLKGRDTAWITIRAATGENVIFRGGSTAFQLSDPAYLIIEGLVFEQQTSNGVNIDDAGTFETPAHHIKIIDCEWRSMSATGNNDELKMSGVDEFLVKNCHFSNSSEGGSLIDMVGCHKGVFEGNYFENGGSNCIQAKGGTFDITIQRNRFVNGGERAINIGGSTGLQFFRPLQTLYEASDIKVWSNVFIGSTAPVAYVGAVNCEVVNNTFINPGTWALRILQENNNPGILTCGNNIFRNNLIVIPATGSPVINIGPNTNPGSFIFSNNLWYNSVKPFWSGPELPVSETGQILNADPQFLDVQYHLKSSSPAIGQGYPVQLPENDYFGKRFAANRVIGAIEY